MQFDDVVGDWYEGSLPAKERKKRGHFSTPPELVEQILDACRYIPTEDLRHIRVLDPACGSGNFLMAAAHRLLTWASQAGLSQAATTALIQHNLWGFDSDPVSCALTEMRLRHIVPRGKKFHIHQADALAFPWGAQQTIDLLIANPPYLATKNNDLSGYGTTLQRGQGDSYLLFLRLAMQIVRPYGWLGLVLPDPVLARTNATQERLHLLQTTTIQHLWHLADVFPAHVGTIVIIAQKCPPTSTHQIPWVRAHWQKGPPRGNPLVPLAGAAPLPPCLARSHQGESPLYPLAGAAAPPTLPSESPRDASTIPQALLLQQPRREIRYLLGNERGMMIAHLHAQLDNVTTSSSRFAPLRDFLAIHRGEELGRNSPYLIKGSGFLPVLRGGREVRSYATAAASHVIARETVRKPIEWYLTPKLLVVKSTYCLQATLDLQGHIVLQTLYMLTPHLPTKDTDDLYFFLALLNSQILRDYVFLFYTAYKWVQPQIEQHVLAHLPIPIVDHETKADIIQRSKLLMTAHDRSSTSPRLDDTIKAIYAEQEQAICKLYEELC